MKKLMLFLSLFVGYIMPTYAQDNIVLYIADRPEPMILCLDHNQTVTVYAQQNCDEFLWTINGVYHNENPIVVDSQIDWTIDIGYTGCDFSYSFVIEWMENPIPNAFTHIEWKRFDGIGTLEAVGSDSTDYPFYYNFLWSTGESTRNIDVTDPGTYTCEISGLCGSVTRTFIVQDNVEIDLATCDLETNLNMVTWQTTTAQAEYIDHVIIKRDGLEVGTANYSDGFFLDNIGSDLAQRTYTVIAVDTDGSQCPIVSYPKETIHMAYLTGVNNTIEVNWNIPTGYDLLGYNICEWIPNGKDGELNVIDFVGATVTSYTCQVSQFTSGYVIIQGVEAGKTESRLLSNRSSETVGIGEYGMERFKVYPNPTNGIITVETVHAPSLQGQTEYRITNVMGQTLLRGTIEAEKQQIDIQCLLQGVYFISVGSETRKIVME